MKKTFIYAGLLVIIISSSFIISSKPDNARDNLADTEVSATIVKDTISNNRNDTPIVSYDASKTMHVQQKLDSLMKRIHKRHDFHGSILVAKKGKIVYQNEIGTADFRKKTPITKASVYQLASVSKQFTAASILILAERNQLKLTDTITKFYPNFPYKNITITHLLNHTSGLPKYFWIAEHEWKEAHPPTNKELMKFIETSSAASIFFRPGRGFDYSNTGYFVLAAIVEQVSQMRFSDFVKTAIFRPLQMHDSFVFSYKNDTLREHQLAGYRIYRGWRHAKIRGTVNDAVVGDKNVYTTQEDLFKWIHGLNSGKILSKKLVAQMYTKGETKHGRKVPYGFGFRIDTKSDEKVVYHFGKWNGFSTGLSQYKDDLVISILEHTSYRAMGTLTKKVKRIVDKNFNL